MKIKHKYLSIIFCLLAYILLIQNCFAATAIKFFYTKSPTSGKTMVEWIMYQDTVTSLFTAGIRFYYKNDAAVRVEQFKIIPGPVTQEFPYLPYQLVNLTIYHSPGKPSWSINFGTTNSPNNSYGPKDGYQYHYDQTSGAKLQRDYMKFYYGSNNSYYNYNSPQNNYPGELYGYYSDIYNSETYDSKSMPLWNVIFGYVQNNPAPYDPFVRSSTVPLEGTRNYYDPTSGQLLQKDSVKFFYNGGYNNYHSGGPNADYIPVPYGYTYNKTKSETFNSARQLVWSVTYGYVANSGAPQYPNSIDNGIVPIDGFRNIYDPITKKLAQKDSVKFYYNGSYNYNYNYAGPGTEYIPVPYGYLYNQYQAETFNDKGKVLWKVRYGYIQNMPYNPAPGNNSSVGPIDGYSYIYDLSTGKLKEKLFGKFFYNGDSYSSNPAIPYVPVPYNYKFQIASKECYYPDERIEWCITYGYNQYYANGPSPVTGHHYVYTTNSSQISDETVRFNYVPGGNGNPANWCVPYDFSFNVVRKTLRTSLPSRGS